MTGDGEKNRLAGTRPNLEKRAAILRLIRQFFDGQGFIEVDTPVRSPAIAPEKEIVPFSGDGWFLSTSPELYMKRLLAAGCERIYQISHSFRKGERGRLHNPEFTILEWYRSGADYMTMIEDAERLVSAVAAGLGVGDTIKYQGKTLDLTPPWGRITVSDLYRQLAGWDPVLDPDEGRFNEDMVNKIIPVLNPHRFMVMMDYPAPMASLARLKKGRKDVAERAEVFAGQIELANAYSELTNEKQQRSRFRKEIGVIKKEQGRATPMPEKFLAAMSELPECAGIALGIDRLVMLFCDAASIDEVLAFPEEQA